MTNPRRFNSLLSLAASFDLLLISLAAAYVAHGFAVEQVDRFVRLTLLSYLLGILVHFTRFGQPYSINQDVKKMVLVRFPISVGTILLTTYILHTFFGW